MPLTERVQILMSREMRKKLGVRAREEHKSIGALMREFAETGLGEPPRADRLRALERLSSMELPVGDWDQMEREIEAGRLSESHVP